ncbi:MAG TPA: hypothetical protein VHD81_04240 [Mycobacteriales bacterium]|nr:hypothetical protein [Mycobacteriales bacterium]
MSTPQGTIVNCLNDLIAALGLQDLDALRKAIELYPEEGEGFLDLRDEPRVLIVGVGAHGTGLEYPFAVEEVWTTLDDLDAEYYEELANDPHQELRDEIEPRIRDAWDSGGVGTFTTESGYVQWAKYTAGLQIECVSNAFLGDDDRLGFVQRRLLANLGFTSPQPPSWPNYFRRFTDESEIGDAATILVRVITDVLNQPD